MKLNDILLTSSIKSMVHEIRGIKVMIDKDLALLYSVKTKELNKAVKAQ